MMDTTILTTLSLVGLVIEVLAIDTATNIRLLYDESLNESYIESTLSVINATVHTAPGYNITDSICPPSVTARSIQDMNFLELVEETNGSDPTIILIPCSLCEQTLTWIINAQVTQLLCVESSPQQLMTCRSSALIMSLLSRLVSHLNMQDVIIFTDSLSTNSVNAIQKVLPTTHTIIWQGDDSWSSQANGPVNSTAQMNRVVNSSYGNYIVSTNREHALTVIMQSHEIKLFGPEFNWLVDMRADPNTAQTILPTLLQDGDNTAVVLLAETFNETLKLDIIRSLREAMGYEPPSRWPTKAKPFPVLDVYKCIIDCKIIRKMTHVSTVSSNGHITNNTMIFPDQFRGFHQRLFKVVIKVYEPFVILERHKNGTAKYRGMAIEILTALAEALDFRYELFEVKDGMFGVRNSSGQWNGLIGTVARGEADIAVTGITVSSARDQVIDYTFPFWEEPSTVLLKKPKDGSKYTSVFRPFMMSTWYGLIASVFASSILLYVICALTRRFVGIYEPLVSFWDCLWYCYGAMLGQGTDKQPESLSSRAVASCWWLVVIVMYAVYTGNLIAFLTVNIPNMPFNSLEGMVSQTTYTYGLEDGIIHMMLFREAESGVYSDIWKGIQRNLDSVVVKTAEIGLEKVSSESYAFIGEKTYLQAKSAANCDLVMIQEEFFKSSFAFAVQDGWPFKKYLDAAIMSMVETGFVNYWKKKHFVSSRCAVQAASVELGATQLDDMSGLFVVFCFGGLLAAATLLGEVIIKKYQNRKPKSSSSELYLDELAYAAKLAQNSIPFSVGLEKGAVSYVDPDVCVGDIPNDNLAYYSRDTWHHAVHHDQWETRDAEFTNYGFDAP